MGRKNKMKLLKHANSCQSPTPSGTGDTSLVGNDINSERQPLEVVKTNLREIISHSPTEGNQRLLCLFSELEKKSAELDVAKKLIRQLQGNVQIEFAHGDIGAELDQENVRPDEGNISQVEIFKASIEPALDQIGRRVDILSDERSKLEDELQTARGNVQRLETEVKNLEVKLEKTNDMVQQGEQQSAEVQSNLKQIIQELETSLETSNSQIKDFQQKAAKEKLYQELSDRLREREFAEKEKEIAEASAKLEEDRTLWEQQQQVSSAETASQLEKAHSEIESLRKLETELSECVKAKDEALRNSALLDQKIAELSALNQTLQESSSVELKKKNAELEAEKKSRTELETAISEVTRNLNHEQKKHEENVSVIEKMLDASKITIAELAASLELKSTDLDAAIDREKVLKETFETRFVSINNGVQLIKKDLHEVKTDLVKVRDNNMELQLQLTASKADAKHYRDDADNCRKCIKKLEEQFKNEMDLEKERTTELQNQLNAIQGTFQLEPSQTLVEAIQQLKTQLESADAEKKKLDDELFTIRNLVKKIRKERDSSAKKWKKMLDEVTAEKDQLLGKTSELEQRLNESANSSASDDSISEQPETARSQCDSLREVIGQLDASSKDSELKVEKLSKLLVEKEKESLDVHQTLVAQQAKIAELEEDAQRVKSTLESRITELQRSAENCQSRFDEDVEQLRQKLEASESSLTVQQEMNARLTADSDEMSLEMSQLQETQVKLAETAKNTIEGIEKEKLEALEALRLCKASLDAVQNEVGRVQELERAKTDVLVNATEEEKKRIRDELESIKSELENARKTFKEQKAESKKHFDNETRKVKKLLKAAEEQKTEIESKIVELESKLSVETSEAETLRSQIQRQAVEIEKLSTERALSEQAVLEMAEELERREKEHTEALNAERSTAAEEKSDLELKQSLLEKEIEYVAKKLDDATKKDKVAQLENRIEVIQTAAKAQQKRLEDEIAKTKSLSEASIAEKNEELEKRAFELQTLHELIEKFTEQLDKATATEHSVVDLEQRIKSLQMENAEERTGLVDELIATKQKIEKVESAHKASIERVQTLEKQLEEKKKPAVVHRYPEVTMVPMLNDSPFRLPPVLAENPSLFYGLVGFFSYIVLLHIYLLL